MNSLDSVAQLICNVNLDKDLLCWEEGNFFTVTAHSMGHSWRMLQIVSHRATDCDYALVAQNVSKFLEQYNGDKKPQISAQLKKLQSLSEQPVKILSEPVAEQPVKTLTKPVEQNLKIVKTVKKNKKPPKLEQHEELFQKYLEKTIEIKEEYLPFLPNNTKSCRFGIGCPKKTAIALPDTLEKEHGYLHANHVSLGINADFIATLYPLNRIVFWWAVLEKGNAIVDLTNADDHSMHYVQRYSPQKPGEIMTYGSIIIECLSVENISSHLTSYKLLITDYKTEKEKVIERCHYTGWQDESGTSPEELLNLIQKIEPYLGQNNQVPIVHCMGGVGRTGTCLTAVAIKKLIDQKQITDFVNFENQMENLILTGRKQRGPEFLRTPTQIQTLCQLSSLLLDK